MSIFDAASPTLPWSEAEDLISFYEDAKLIGCSAALGRKYQIAASSQATIWSVYPELLSSHHKLVVESVHATGFPRSIDLPDGTGRASSEFSRSERPQPRCRSRQSRKPMIASCFDTRQCTTR